MPVVHTGLLSPLPPSTRGAYYASIGGITATAPGAGATSLSFRWGSTTHVAIVTAVSLGVFVQTTLSGTAPAGLAVALARGFTASDTGGTAITPVSLDSGMPSSLVTDFRFATLSSLTAGTRGLVTSPLFVALSGIGSTVNHPVQTGPEAGELRSPILLRQNEGLLVNNFNALTGGSLAYVATLQWIEVPNEYARTNIYGV